MATAHYAEAFSPLAGRCFRLVDRAGEAGPTHCPQPPRWRGSFRTGGGRRDAVEACDGHRGPLEHARPLPPRQAILSYGATLMGRC
jgi:hypothetical protein